MGEIAGRQAGGTEVGGCEVSSLGDTRDTVLREGDAELAACLEGGGAGYL